MFQSLRPNNQLFILHRDTAVLDKGSIVSVSSPVPNYTKPAVYGQPQEFIVDLVVKINNQDISFKGIPANRDVAEFKGDSTIISCSKEAMNAEILSLKQQSSTVLDSIDYHKDIVKKCDTILHDLNPEFAEKQKQQLEINSLKSQMGEMSKNIAELMELNKNLMLQLKKE